MDDISGGLQQQTKSVREGTRSYLAMIVVHRSTPERGPYWTACDIIGNHMNLLQLVYEDHMDYYALNRQWGLVLYAWWQLDPYLIWWMTILCRCEFSVFLVWAVTIILAGCNCNALGLKRARRGVVVKRNQFVASWRQNPRQLTDYHLAEAQYIAYRHDLYILQVTTQCWWCVEDPLIPRIWDEQVHKVQQQWV